MRRWIDLFEHHQITPTDRAAARAALDEMRPNYSIDSMFGHLEDEEIDDELDDLLSAAEWTVVSHVRDGQLPVFREIVAPANWDITQETRPHAFWSYDANAAHAHWGEGEGVRWLIAGMVSAHEVDWPATIAHNANPALTDECEVRLLPQARVSHLTAERRPDGWQHSVY